MDLNEVKKTEKLSNMHEVAAFMGISYMTLYRLVKSGKIKAVNLAPEGKKPIFAFRAEDVQEYYDHLSNTIKGGKSLDK
jgi:excisionase family DNA binding protein